MLRCTSPELITHSFNNRLIISRSSEFSFLSAIRCCEMTDDLPCGRQFDAKNICPSRSIQYSTSLTMYLVIKAGVRCQVSFSASATATASLHILFPHTCVLLWRTTRVKQIIRRSLSGSGHGQSTYKRPSNSNTNLASRLCVSHLHLLASRDILLHLGRQAFLQ